jgi:hypothetical protein
MCSQKDRQKKRETIETTEKEEKKNLIITNK